MSDHVNLYNYKSYKSGNIKISKIFSDFLMNSLELHINSNLFHSGVKMQNYISIRKIGNHIFKCFFLVVQNSNVLFINFLEGFHSGV